MADPFKDTRDPLVRSMERADRERVNREWHQARDITEYSPIDASVKP